MTTRAASERASTTALSQTDVVIQELKRLVVQGVLGPGDRLPIETQGVGSVEEAVKMLLGP